MQTEVNVCHMTVRVIKDVIAGIGMNLHCFPDGAVWEQWMQRIYIVSLEGQ